MSKLMGLLFRFMATALLGIIVLMVLGWGGAQAQAQGQARVQAQVQAQVQAHVQAQVQAHVLVPPLAAALVDVCRGQPCLATLPEKLQDPVGLTQSKSRKRRTRRST